MADSVQGDWMARRGVLSSDQPGNEARSAETSRFDRVRRPPAKRGTCTYGDGTPVPIVMLVPRQRATLMGRVNAISLHLWPATSYKVELNDGTGTVFLRFMGRRSLPGFEPGRWLSVEGTPAEISGQVVLLNPLYSFLAEPPHSV
jgi:hypothetical protein